MKEMFSKVIVIVGFGLFYFLLSKFIGFEETVIVCFASIIGQKLNQNKDESNN